MHRRTAFVLALLLALATALIRCAPSDSFDEPVPVDDRSAQPLTAGGALKIMSYNIKHAELSSIDSIANVINGQSPDIVALQEVDVLTNRSGKVDQAARLGQLTGMFHAFQPSLTNFDSGQYGLALLSRYPILSSQRIALRSAAEQRILALMEVELPAQHVIPVGVTHFGTTGSAERVNQADDIKAALAGKPGAILAGDLNASPSEACITSLRQMLTDAWTRGGSGNGYTHSSGFPTKRIDYVLLGPTWAPAVSASVVSATSQSDHRPVVAALTLPWSQTLFADRVPNNTVEEADTRSVELGVKLRSNVDGSIEAIRFYRGTGNSSGYMARLWTSSGVLLAQAPVTDGAIPGWQEVHLPSPVAITAGTTYVASYYTSNGRFARDPGGLTNAISSGNLTAPGSASAGGNGVYAYGGGGFPSNTYKETNYWVDVRFSPAQ
jgi:endonuclease/exonuclease/phosphatase family metal-dependent hydrolase